MQAPATLSACVLERLVEDGSDPQAGLLIGLHDAHSTASEIFPFLRRIGAGRRIVAPRSARWSAHGQGGRYSWFSSVSPPVVEPVGFGDALIQLEALALDEARSPPAGGCVLAGVGQGGSMALVLAAIWPELFRRVIAIDAMWPVVPGWQLPDLAMRGTAVLLVGGGDGLGARLTERGAAVTAIADIQSGTALADACRQWLSAVPNANSRR